MPQGKYLGKAWGILALKQPRPFSRVAEAWSSRGGLVDSALSGLSQLPSKEQTLSKFPITKQVLKM